MPPRQFKRPTAAEIRNRNVNEIAGWPGLAGRARVGALPGGRGGAQSVLTNVGDDPGESIEGTGQVLVMSATAASIDPGGDHVAFDTVVAVHGFGGVVTPVGGAWVHPVSSVYALVHEHEWDTYQGGGTIRLELDGVLVPEGVLIEGSSGQQGSGTILYRAAAGQVGKIHVEHNDASAQTCDATVRIGVTDPTADTSWVKVFAAAAWGIAFDGSYWWTTTGDSTTVTKRDAVGAALSSFAATDAGSTTALVRGIHHDGSALRITGAEDGAYYYSEAGVLLSSFVLPVESHMGIAFDGTDLWIVEDQGNNLRRYDTAGVLQQTIALTASDWAGLAIYSGDLFVVDSTNLALVRYTTAGVLVETIDVSGATSWPTGVWIASDGTLYISSAGGGVYRRGTKIGA